MLKKKVTRGRSTLSKVSYKHIPCVNTQYNDSTYWFGRICDSDSVMVDESCIRVVCSVCIAHITAPGDPDLKKQERINYPKGWALLKEFVDERGNVYHKGKEQESLYGTLPPTDVVEMEKQTAERKKNSKIVEKPKNNKPGKLLDNSINVKNIELSKLKKLLKTTKSPKEQQKIVNEIKKLEKEIIREK